MRNLVIITILTIFATTCQREYTVENDPKDLSIAVMYMSDFYRMYANSQSDSIWILYNPSFSKEDFRAGTKDIESRIGNIQQVKSKVIKTTSTKNSNGLKKEFIISLEGKYQGGSTDELLTIQEINGKARVIGYKVEKIYEND